MTNLARVLLVVFAMTILIPVLGLFRKHRISAGSASLWLVLSSFSLTMAVFAGLPDRIADALGISYPPALFFAVGNVFLVVFAIYVSTQLTTARHQIRSIAERLAILEEEVESKQERP